MLSQAQGVVPVAKTKAERKAERKKMTLEQKIEDVLPIDVSLPKANVNLPGGNKISSIADAKKFMNETVPNTASSAKLKGKKLKKALKKAKEEVFDGKYYEKIAIQKKIYKRGSGSRLQYIEFYVLKNHQKTSPYHRLITWQDHKTGKLVEAITRDPKTNSVLHGPYKEYRGENLISEGFYFLGVKHGRWVSYDKDFILVEKETYNKGFYAESEITYYDTDSSKINEITPILYGKQSGNYWKFFVDGTVAVEGNYDSGIKIGKWIEYYEGGNRRKKVTQYPGSIFDESESYVVVEYDPTGKITYENPNRK